MRLIFVSLAFTATVRGACYFPNGNDTNLELQTDTYAPCGDTKTHGMCCRTNDPNHPDVCEPNSLCSNGKQLWRESCTDPLWESDACVKLCVNGTASIDVNSDAANFATTHVLLTTCDDGSLCCGSPATEAAKSCCIKGQGVWLVNGKVVSTNPTLSPTAATASAKSAPTATPSSIRSSSPQLPESTTNVGTIVGTVIGGVGGLALIAGFTWYILRKRRASRLASEHDLFMYNKSLSPYAELTEESKVTYAHHQAPAVELADAETGELSAASPAREQRTGELAA